MTNVAGHIGVVAPVVSPLEAGDHYILRKLNNQVLPWIIAGRRLRKLWMVRLARLYDYASNLAAALAGLGIGAPVVSLLASNRPPPPGENALDILTQNLPYRWLGVGIAALVIWVALRVFIQKEDIIGRALLARDCAQTMRALYQQLYSALPDSDPMPVISKVQKSVDDQVNNAIRNKIWPWDPLPPPEELSAELAAAIVTIRSNYMSGWSAPPPGAI